MTIKNQVNEILEEQGNITENELIFWYLEKKVCLNFIERFFLKLIFKRCKINLGSLEVARNRIVRKNNS